MTFTSVVTKNADGSYTSSGGHEVTADSSGRLWVSGAPIGLRDTGYGGIGLEPSTWNPAIGGGSGAAVVRSAPALVGGWSAGSSPRTGMDRPLLHRGTLMYPWMFAVGVFAYQLVSGAQVFGRPALHANAVFGVAALLFVVWAYRELMTRALTAVPFGLVSSMAFAAVVAGSLDAKAGRFLGLLWRGLGKAAFSGDSLLTAVRAVVLNPWFFGALAVGLTLHVVYWRHRIASARRYGWLMTAPLSHTLGNAVWLLLLAGAVGGVMSFWR